MIENDLVRISYFTGWIKSIATSIQRRPKTQSDATYIKVWKHWCFSATQILCEIKSDHFTVRKLPFWQFWFWEISGLTNCKNYKKLKSSDPHKLKEWQFLNFEKHQNWVDVKSEWQIISFQRLDKFPYAYISSNLISFWSPCIRLLLTASNSLHEDY